MIFVDQYCGQFPIRLIQLQGFRCHNLAHHILDDYALQHYHGCLELELSILAKP